MKGAIAAERPGSSGGQANSGAQQEPMPDKTRQQPGDRKGQPKSGHGDSMKPAALPARAKRVPTSTVRRSRIKNQPPKPADKKPEDRTSPEKKGGRQSPSIERTETDSKGQKQGERSGGGGKGGGQRANQSGHRHRRRAHARPTKGADMPNRRQGRAIQYRWQRSAVRSSHRPSGRQGAENGQGFEFPTGETDRSGGKRQIRRAATGPKQSCGGKIFR